MAHIDIEIADLESILTNFTENHSQEEIKEMERELKRYMHIKNLWEEFGDIPMDPETECLELPFTPKNPDGKTITVFPERTHREEIWRWFEEYFDLSIAENLMYK